MSVTYQQLLVNTINEIISKLINGAQPAKDPGMTAWTWFGASTGAQPTQADEYVQTQLSGGMSTTTTTYSPTNNWSTWSTALNTNLSGATGDIRKWLDNTYTAVAADLPTVPEDVVTWTKNNLPTGVTVVMRRGQGVKR